MKLRRPFAVIFGIFIVFTILLVAGGLWVRGTLRGSLAQLEGESVLPGLRGRVLIQRDALGIPTISAFNKLDQARAIGFLHGQERFFQMDLLRRVAAGELAEIIPAALEVDKEHRIHQFRRRALISFEQLDTVEILILEAYAEGVNAGVDQLNAKPFEYFLLGGEPTPWTPVDSLLVAQAMTLDLMDSKVIADRYRGLLHRHLSPEVFDFFYHNGSRWEATQDGSNKPILAIPSATEFESITKDWPAAPASPMWARQPSKEASRYFPETGPNNGSNSWAIAGHRNGNGDAAWVANDMHLSIRIPHIWYRAAFQTQSDSGEAILVAGATLPGTPSVIVGSNGSVAWGLTNSNADTGDAVIIEIDPANPNNYLTAQGSMPFTQETEQIQIGADSLEALNFRSTIFGPIVGEDDLERPIAAQWTAHFENAVNFQIDSLAQASSVAEALQIAQSAGTPSLNFIAGDRAGNIGWTLMGRVPERRGSYNGFLPILSSAPDALWVGPIDTSSYPTLEDPDHGILITANARIVGGEALQTVGDGGYAMPARQFQIHDRLHRSESIGIDENAAAIMDSRVFAMNPWRDILVEFLEQMPDISPNEATILDIAKKWDGSADASSAAYRVIREFRGGIMDRMHNRILGTILEKDSSLSGLRGFNDARIPIEEAYLLVAEEKPAYLTDPYFGDWESEFQYVLDSVITHATSNGESLEGYTWGKANVFHMQHPISSAVPALSPFLDFEPVSISSDRFAPNALFGNHGPSQRMIIEVGKESEARFTMPGGQSGHPLSPFYRSGHVQWLQGVDSPLLPGEEVYRLVINPE
ncbi:MAG: penicillin acylase family protein [Opitutales bacterium]|nr:penicillin acylase family protein [Opitutales bacterium]NRA25763.1 penicillin acylase family protein [Opitutales bacterium]